jgi:hypothetical protein
VELFQRAFEQSRNSGTDTIREPAHQPEGQEPGDFISRGLPRLIPRRLRAS